MLNCRECRTEIEIVSLTEDLSARAAAHLATCAACRMFETEQTSLRRLLGTLEPVGAPADFEFRLRARMTAQPHTTARFILPRLSLRALALAAAACLVLALSMTLKRPTPQPMAGSEPTAAQGSATVAPISVAHPKPIEVAATNTAPVMRDSSPSNSGSAKSTTTGQRPALPLERSRAAGLPTRKSVNGAIGVNDLGVRGAPIVTEAALHNPVTLQSIPISVAASAKPLKVFFKDTQGAERMISLEPVSFGARDLPGTRATGPRVRPVVNQGVW